MVRGIQSSLRRQLRYNVCTCSAGIRERKRSLWESAVALRATRSNEPAIRGGVEKVGNPFVQAFLRLIPFVIFTAYCCVDQALRLATGAISIFLYVRITSLVVAHIRQGTPLPPHFARLIQSVFFELNVINSFSMFVGYEAAPVSRWTNLFSKEVPVHIEQLTGLMGVTTILPLEGTF